MLRCRRPHVCWLTRGETCSLVCRQEILRFRLSVRSRGPYLQLFSQAEVSDHSIEVIRVYAEQARRIVMNASDLRKDVEDQFAFELSHCLVIFSPGANERCSCSLNLFEQIFGHDHICYSPE